MNKHLKSAVGRDRRRTKPLISPICNKDAEIIWELQIALSRLDTEESDELKSIVEEWKYLKDEEIYSLLLGWNIAHPEGFKGDDENNEGRKFISFDGELLEIALIKSVSKDEYYNYSTNELEYRIIINKDFPEGFLLSDLTFTYPTYEVMDVMLRKLEKNLSKKIKII